MKPQFKLPDGFPADAIWRGWDEGRKEWVYGYPAQAGGGICILLLRLNETTVAYRRNFSTIDPATLSRCTGKQDKDGTFVFGGDVVSHNGAGWTIFQHVSGAWMGGFDGRHWPLTNVSDFGVIVGNNWDKNEN